MIYVNSAQVKTCIKAALIIFSEFLFAQSIPLTPQNWKVVYNENNQELDLQVTEYKGMSAIHLGRHEIAELTTAEHKNFVLEMDVAGKAMPAIGFRAEDLWDYEFLYFRVFAGGKNTAIQYIPVYNGAHPWQLYNEPIYETTAVFKPEEWFHIKVEVFGENMRVFVGEKEQPNMQVELLQKECDKGSIFLKTSFAEAYFSNIKIQVLEKPFSIKEPETQFKYITKWEISEQLQGSIHSQRQYLKWIENAEKNHKWQNIEADKTGIINMAQYYDHPKESAFAKTTINSDVAKTVTLAYDYTQVLLVSLNNKIVFYGRELDIENFMRVTDREQTLELSLNEGENKLVFWIRSDDEWQNQVGNPPYLGRKQAMNWGFMARLLEEE